MAENCIHFLLVPDGNAARRLRRALVKERARKGVIVGTWPELLHHANNAYLVPALEDEWQVKFPIVLAEMTKAFWAQSFKVAPQETAAEIKQAFIRLFSATDPCKEFDLSNEIDIPVRLRQHLNDLVGLRQKLQGALPAEMSSILQLFNTDAGNAIKSIAVYHLKDLPWLSRWQTALVDKLNCDFGDSHEASLSRLLEQTFLQAPKPNIKTGLEALQERLFTPATERFAADNSVQWLGVRDFYQEAEVAAGMVQRMLEQHNDLQPADIGVLIPDRFEYTVAIEHTFRLAGLALSGLPVERWQRGLARETLYHFLYCRQKPAPAMALAVCLSSPLMPWSRQGGAQLAQNIMDGDYKFKPLTSFSYEAKAMLELIREGDTTQDTLSAAILAFSDLLNPHDKYAPEVQQVRQLAGDMCTNLRGPREPDWGNLRRSVMPEYITTGAAPDFNLEGVTVWRADQEAWRPVRFLIVFGFHEGNYPCLPKSSSVFSGDELLSLKSSLGIPVQTPDDDLLQRRALFKRQLSSTSDYICFLVPHRNPAGETQTPSSSMVFMEQLFDSSERRILELDVESDRKRIRYLAQAECAKPTPPRPIHVNDIHFQQDLLTLRTDEAGNIKPESPSSLETLMISPLAWLLNRLKAEPLGWSPEQPDAMMLGTLAHAVFEQLFPPQQLLPESNEIPNRVAELLDVAIGNHAPFFWSTQWQVDKKHLQAGITTAAIAWRDILNKLGAQVLATELWLQGNFHGMPIHGQADMLLGLPNKRLLIVDYKRSSAQSRRPRMQSSYDSQAHLYRTMLQTGGPKDTDNAELLRELRKAEQTGIVYYMLNDQTSLSDTRLLQTGAIAPWEVVEGDLSGNAMARIELRLNELRDGLLVLNREGDAEFFEKTAMVKPYALDKSPLIHLYTLPGDTRETE